jgi:hypothetical protein
MTEIHYFDLIFDLSVSFIQQILANRKKITPRVKLIMGTTAFLTYNFIMQLFHFVCEKRLIDWLQQNSYRAGSGLFENTHYLVPVVYCTVLLE